MRGGAKAGGTRGDPHDVLGSRTSGQDDLLPRSDGQGSSDLEDPRVGVGAVDGAVVSNRDHRIELIQASGNPLPPERPSVVV